MPLNVRFDINGEDIGELIITRDDEAEPMLDEVRYWYLFRGQQGSVNGTVWHIPANGAMTLVAKVIEKIDFPHWKPR